MHKLFKLIKLSSLLRCTRVENIGVGVINVFFNIGREVFGVENFKRGSSIFEFHCICFLQFLFKFPWGPGACFILLPICVHLFYILACNTSFPGSANTFFGNLKLIFLQRHLEWVLSLFGSFFLGNTFSLFTWLSFFGCLHSNCLYLFA